MEQDAIAEVELFAGLQVEVAVLGFIPGEVADAEDVGGEQAVGAGVPVGGVAGRVLTLVLEWTALHRVTVRMNWENARLGVPPPPSPR